MPTTNLLPIALLNGTASPAIPSFHEPKDDDESEPQEITPHHVLQEMLNEELGHQRPRSSLKIKTTEGPYSFVEEGGGKQFIFAL